MDESVRNARNTPEANNSPGVMSPHPTEPPPLDEHPLPPVKDAGYSLKFRGLPALNQLVVVAIATAVYIVLSQLSIDLPTGIYNVSSLFIAIGFGLPFALWFGGWAFVIGYLGNFLGAGILSPTPLPLLVAIPFGAADIIQLGLPMLLYRLLAPRFEVSPIGKDILTVKGFAFFFICAALIPNFLGGLYGNAVLVWSGINPANSLIPGWLSWAVTNVIVVTVGGIVLLPLLGPVVERFGLTIRNLLN